MSKLHAWYAFTTPLVQQWWRMSRGVTLGVRVAAIDEAGRVALIRHTYRPGWHLPGGGVDRGEMAENAARRELAEEANAVVDGSLELLSVHSNFAEMRGDHVLFYKGRGRSLGERAPDREIAEVRWMGPQEALDGVGPGTRRRLAELWRAVEASPVW